MSLLSIIRRSQRLVDSIKEDHIPGWEINLILALIKSDLEANQADADSLRRMRLPFYADVMRNVGSVSSIDERAELIERAGIENALVVFATVHRAPQTLRRATWVRYSRDAIATADAVFTEQVREWEFRMRVAAGLEVRTMTMEVAT